MSPNQRRAVLTPLHASSRTAADMKKTDDEESPLTKSLGEGSAAGGSLRGPSYRPHSV